MFTHYLILMIFWISLYMPVFPLLLIYQVATTRYAFLKMPKRKQQL